MMIRVWAYCLMMGLTIGALAPSSPSAATVPGNFNQSATLDTTQAVDAR